MLFNICLEIYLQWLEVGVDPDPRDAAARNPVTGERDGGETATTRKNGVASGHVRVNVQLFL